VKGQRLPAQFRGEERFDVFLLSYKDPCGEIHEMDETETSLRRKINQGKEYG
jgi:hypothetical protein